MPIEATGIGNLRNAREGCVLWQDFPLACFEYSRQPVVDTGLDQCSGKLMEHHIVYYA